MPIIQTQPLPVTSVTPSNFQFSLVLSPLLGPLYIGNVRVSKAAAAGVLTGTLTPGTASSPGRLRVDASDPKYTTLRTNAVMPCHVVISYDSATLAFVDIDISQGAALVAHFGGGAKSPEVEAVALNAGALDVPLTAPDGEGRQLPG